MSSQPGKLFMHRHFWGRVVLGTLTVTGLTMAASGRPMVPGFMAETPPLWGAAWAQSSDISSEAITSYAASVLEMDPYRTEAYTQIQNLLSGMDHDMSAVDMSCTGTANLNQLPRNVRSDVRAIIVDYCNRASTIVQQNGLTVRQFNAITVAYPQDPGLAEQIRTALIQIQQQNASEAQVAPAE